MIVHFCVPWKEVPTAGADHRTTGRHCRRNAKKMTNTFKSE